jgi:outer membrane lipoprotein
MRRAPWWQVWGGVGLLSVVLWGETGCISALSARVRQQAAQTLTFAQLHAKPETYVGRTVILGGEIVRVWNVPGATWFDVAHRPLNPEDQPMLTEPSAGHFVVRYDRYFNPLTYTAGRPVTVAGRVPGHIH